VTARMGMPVSRASDPEHGESGTMPQEIRMRPLTEATVLSVACAVLAGGVLWVQAADPAELAKKYAESARENATLMRQYSWKMRVGITLKGDPKPPELFQMRYDLDGNLQKTLLTAPADPRKKHGIRGMVQKHKTEEFKDWAADLAELVKGYMSPTPGNMMDFYAKASMGEADGGTAKMEASDFLQKGDIATYWIDKQTRAVVRYTFVTALDGDTVEGSVEYGRVPEGPQYAARVTVSVAAKNLDAKLETCDYQRQ